MNLITRNKLSDVDKTIPIYVVSAMLKMFVRLIQKIKYANIHLDNGRRYTMS